MENVEILHKRLKYFREQKKLTRTDVCNALHVTPSTISHWESGSRRPSADFLLELCDLYNIHSIAQLFGSDSTRGDELSTDERIVINLYRNVDTNGKKAVLNLLKGWCL